MSNFAHSNCALRRLVLYLFKQVKVTFSLAKIYDDSFACGKSMIVAKALIVSMRGMCVYMPMMMITRYNGGGFLTKGIQQAVQF